MSKLISKNKKPLIKSKKVSAVKLTKKQEVLEPAFFMVKRALLILMAVGILAFNVVAKVDVSAQNGEQGITIENLLKSHNEYRRSMNLGELRLSSLLNISAQKKADAMLSNSCWSHYCPPGKSPWEFFDEASYSYIYAGENLAEGFYRMDSLMQAWINSKTHRDNMEKPEFAEVGFAIVNGSYLNNPNNILVVVHFGARVDSSILPQENPILEIVSPNNNSTLDSSSVDLSGKAEGIDTVRVFNNNVLQGNASISGGIFTYRLNLTEGSNTLWVDGSNSLTKNIESNKINLIYKPLVESVDQTFVPVSQQNNLEGAITVDQKNNINLFFAVALGIVFLIDVIIVSKTKSLSVKKSFSHYHLSLLFVIGIIILVGGFAGQIQNGLSI